ncbi:alpha/beta fold hydrolase [Cedecea lapagei]|uniref:alpha/beta fold hydrolase n=1 Tax=Cedecea lapagei TaxID=158823 RepID=UPI001BCA9B34|nr:alpha/beta hydrolase [Cedecea lapagei]
MKPTRKTLLALAAAGLMTGFAAQAETQHTIVLVHGAFADATGSWEQVIPPLQTRHYEIITAQIPLTSLADDVAATKRAIARAKGDVILVGHSWGGTVITEAGNDPKVKGLVYINAFAPSPGQSTADLVNSFPAPPGSAKIIKGADGFLSLDPKAVATDFAQDATPEAQNIIGITQMPIAAASFTEKVTTAAWQQKPSWFLVGSNDRMINPELERAMAKKIHAHVTELPVSHVPMLYDPKNVARTIFKAVNITSGN